MCALGLIGVGSGWCDCNLLHSSHADQNPSLTRVHHTWKLMPPVMDPCLSNHSTLCMQPFQNAVYSLESFCCKTVYFLHITIKDITYSHWND